MRRCADPGASCLCRSADDDEAVPWQGQCDVDIALTWMTEVSSSVYATPIITDLFSDGHKDIIVPSFVHYLEVRSSAMFMTRAGLPLAAGSLLIDPAARHMWALAC